jgi:hypothetical protein
VVASALHNHSQGAFEWMPAWVAVGGAQILKVEKEVEKHYLNQLMTTCQKHKNQQRQLRQDAR